MPDGAASERFWSLMPFTKTLGIVVLRYEPDEVTARLAWAPELCTSDGVLHGGAVMALADSTGGACAFLNLPRGRPGRRRSSRRRTSFWALCSGAAVSTSRPLHAGSTIVVVETEVRDESGRLVAKVTQSQLVSPQR